MGTWMRSSCRSKPMYCGGEAPADTASGLCVAKGKHEACDDAVVLSPVTSLPCIETKARGHTTTMLNRDVHLQHVGDGLPQLAKAADDHRLPALLHLHLRHTACVRHRGMLQGFGMLNGPCGGGTLQDFGIQ